MRKGRGRSSNNSSRSRRKERKENLPVAHKVFVSKLP